MLFRSLLNYYGCRCQREMQVVLISCSCAATPLVNAALWPFSLYKAWVHFSQDIKYVKEKRICYCRVTMLCVFSLLQTSADAFPPLPGWTEESHVTLAVLSSAFPHHILPSHLAMWNVLGKAREGLGTAERSLLACPGRLRWSGFMDCFADPWNISWRLCTNSEEVLG